jgi:hypothetical protein
LAAHCHWQNLLRDQRRKECTSWKKTALRSPGYDANDLIDDLDAVRDVYTHLGRDRFAIYEYWEAAYRLRRKWRRLQRRGLKLKRIARQAINGVVPSSSGDDLLRLIIDLTITTTATNPTANIGVSELDGSINELFSAGRRSADTSY